MNDDTFFSDFGLDPTPRPASERAPLTREGWGLFPAVTPEEYHADFAPAPSLSNSSMGRLLNETPLDFAFHHPRLNPDAVEEARATSAKRRGDLVHQLALGKGSGYAVLPFDDWRTNAAKAARAEAEAGGLLAVKEKDFDAAEDMASMIRDRIGEVLEGATYETEVAFLYQEMTAAGPIWIRGLMDVWCEELGVILDPKTTAMLYNDKVARHMLAMGWDRQAALYTHAISQIFPERAGRVKFADLMVKPDAPFTSRLVGLPKDWEWSAVKQCQMAFERFGACLYAGEWPGFGNKVHRVTMPAWEAKRREAAEMGEAV